MAERTGRITKDQIIIPCSLVALLIEYHLQHHLQHHLPNLSVNEQPATLRATGTLSHCYSLDRRPAHALLLLPLPLLFLPLLLVDRHDGVVAVHDG